MEVDSGEEKGTDSQLWMELYRTILEKVDATNQLKSHKQVN
jgi:hypothetical protein